jgi:hypothetical protein
MKPRAERYDPKNPHGRGCTRLCCGGGGRDYDEKDKIPPLQKIGYLRGTLYAVGVVALLSLIGYCSQVSQDSQRSPVADLSYKLK